MQCDVGEARTGVRAEGYSKFLVGVRDDLKEGVFYTLTKVGTGYSSKVLQELRLKLDGAIIPYQKGSICKHLPKWHISSKSDRCPDVLFDPSKSVVLQIRCGEIKESDTFSSGYNCRFPRVERVRFDKPVQDVLTLSELKIIKDNLRRKVSSNDNNNNNGLVDTRSATKGKRKRNTNTNNDNYAEKDKEGGRKPPNNNRGGGEVNLLSQNNRHKISKTSDLFSDRIFCVFDCDFSLTTDDNNNNNNISENNNNNNNNSDNTSVNSLISFPILKSRAADLSIGIPGIIKNFSRDEITRMILSNGGEIISVLCTV